MQGGGEILEAKEKERTPELKGNIENPLAYASKGICLLNWHEYAMDLSQERKTAPFPSVAFRIVIVKSYKASST